MLIAEFWNHSFTKLIWVDNNNKKEPFTINMLLPISCQDLARAEPRDRFMPYDHEQFLSRDYGIANWDVYATMIFFCGCVPLPVPRLTEVSMTLSPAGSLPGQVLSWGYGTDGTYCESWSKDQAPSQTACLDESSHVSWIFLKTRSTPQISFACALNNPSRQVSLRKFVCMYYLQLSW